MATQAENLERLLLTQKLIKAKLFEDLEDVIDRMVEETTKNNNIEKNNK